MINYLFFSVKIDMRYMQTGVLFTHQSVRLCVLVYLATLMLWRTMTRPTSSTNMITVTPTTATTSPATAAQPAPAAGSTAAR